MLARKLPEASQSMSGIIWHSRCYATAEGLHRVLALTSMPRYGVKTPEAFPAQTEAKTLSTSFNFRLGLAPSLK